MKAPRTLHCWMHLVTVKPQEKSTVVTFLDGRRSSLKRPPLNKCEWGQLLRDLHERFYLTNHEVIGLEWNNIILTLCLSVFIFYSHRQQFQESEAIHAVHKEDKQLKSGMTVAMTAEFESKFKMKLESGAFKSLLKHLSERSDAVQNIDLMTISGFCRNCLAKWMVLEARKLTETIRGVCQDSFTEEEEQLVRDLDAFGYDEAAEFVYGTKYDEWKKAHARKATNEQISMYKLSSSIHAQHDKKLLEKQAEAGPGKFDGQEEDAAHHSSGVFISPIQPKPEIRNPSPRRTASASPSILKVRDPSGQIKPKTGKKATPSDVCCEDVDARARRPASAGSAYRTPPPPKANLDLRVGILTVSDRAARNEYENGDLSGPAVESSLAENIGKANSRRSELDETKAMVKFCVKSIVPDDTEEIKNHLLEWCGEEGGTVCDLIFTTGGTGFSPRDVTPEATREVIEREASGLMTFTTSLCASMQPLAALSRCTAGIRGETVIVNLPGNPAAVGQMLDILVPLLLHAVKDVKGL